MDIVQLKKQIKEKNLNNFYIFSGEEIGILNIYINQMSDNIVRADEVSEVWAKLTSRTLGTASAVYVVRDDKKFIQAEKAWTGIHEKIKNGILVFCSSNLDKRSKFAKEFEEDTVVFERMTKAQLVQFAKKQLKGTKQCTIEYLIDLCDNDYSRVVNEIDKVKRLDCEVTDAVLESIIIPPQESTPFTYVDAMISGMSYEAIYDVNELTSEGKSGVGIQLLGLLYNNFRNAILVVGNPNGNHGVNGYVAGNIKKKLAYEPTELLAILRIIQKYEKGIKRGEYEENFAIKAATVEILSI